MKLCLIVLVVLIGTSLALAKTDPELKQCSQRWKVQRQYSEDKKPGRRQEGEGEENITEVKYDNPYVFRREDFVTTVKSDHGGFYVLPGFTNRSPLLRGVENYRLSIIEANPQTFISPSHWDADTILYVANGRGTVAVINQDKRRSFNIERGDVIRLRANTHCYIINRDDHEKLSLLSFLRPVNLPGQHRSFVAPNVDARGSFYQAFSSELLEAAFQTDRSRIERVFVQRQQGIVKASKEQIQAMANHGWADSRFWAFISESGGPFNLLREPPVLSNNYGQLIEATPDKHKKQLQDLDLMISFIHITQGSMMGPHYNSRAIKISVVVDGEGHFEMASPPDFSTSSPQPKGPSYARVSSRLTPGMVFIIPAGYPVSVVAYPNSTLKIVSFEVNAHGNVRFPLAGRNNVVKQWEREAKELSFGVEAREVDQVFGSQNEEWFFPGQKRRRVNE